MPASKEITKAQAILARLREPSTMAGLSAIAILVGRQATEVQLWFDAAAAVLAILAVVLSEQKPGQ